MKIKRFFAKDMRTALAEVKETLGADAVIMSNKKVSGGVEIVAAMDGEQTKITDNAPQAKRTLANDNVSIKQSGAKFAHLLDKYQANTAHDANENAFLAKQQRQSDAINHFYQQHRQQETDHTSQQLQNMQDEMNMMRKLLEHQVSSLLSQEIEREEPLRALLNKGLQHMGLAATLADNIAKRIPKHLGEPQAWQRALALLADQIIINSHNILDQGGVIALVGPTGVGKTTTLAKLAARAAMDYGSSEIALVTTDTFRIGAYEQLMTYGRILNCPVKQAKDAKELENILLSLRHKKLIFLDTAGMGQRDHRLARQLDTLMQSHNAKIQSFLVLSATSQSNVLEEALAHFQRIPLQGCILTKIDECLSLGAALSVMIEARLPLAYLTNGQRVPEDIRQANSDYIIAKAHELMQQYQFRESTIY